MKRKAPIGNVRRVASIGNNFRGVTTNKRGRLTQFESEQERKLILLLERDTSVVDFVSQPETLTFIDALGRTRKYTPDFKVWRANGQIELHEVTIESRRATRESAQEREAAAQRICQMRGWRYVVHTDKTLPLGYEYANLDFLSAYRAGQHADSEQTQWWLAQLFTGKPMHPQVILDQAKQTASGGRLLNGLYHLLWHDTVQMNWHRPFIQKGRIDSSARVWLSAIQTTGCSSVRSEEAVRS